MTGDDDIVRAIAIIGDPTCLPTNDPRTTNEYYYARTLGVIEAYTRLRGNPNGSPPDRLLDLISAAIEAHRQLRDGLHLPAMAAEGGYDR